MNQYLQDKLLNLQEILKFLDFFILEELSFEKVMIVFGTRPEAIKDGSPVQY